MKRLPRGALAEVQLKRSADSSHRIRSHGEVRHLPASPGRSGQFSTSMLCQTARRAGSDLTGAWVGTVLDKELKRRLGSPNHSRLEPHPHLAATGRILAGKWIIPPSRGQITPQRDLWNLLRWSQVRIEPWGCQSARRSRPRLSAAHMSIHGSPSLHLGMADCREVATMGNLLLLLGEAQRWHSLEERAKKQRTQVRHVCPCFTVAH